MTNDTNEQLPPPQELPPESPGQAADSLVKPRVSVATILSRSLVGLVVLSAVAMVIFTAVSLLMFRRNDRNLFGYRAFIVLSDSMSATDFRAGDVVVVKSVDPATLAPGDIIAYTSRDASSYGGIITHKIRSLTTTHDGRPAFITYGTTTGADDETPVSYGNILGKYQFSLPKVGIFFQFLRSGPGYLLFVLIPLILLIGHQIIQTLRQYRQFRKKEQDE